MRLHCLPKPTCPVLVGAGYLNTMSKRKERKKLLFGINEKIAKSRVEYLSKNPTAAEILFERILQTQCNRYNMTYQAQKLKPIAKKQILHS